MNRRTPGTWRDWVRRPEPVPSPKIGKAPDWRRLRKQSYHWLLLPGKQRPTYARRAILVELRRLRRFRDALDRLIDARMELYKLVKSVDKEALMIRRELQKSEQRYTNAKAGGRANGRANMEGS
jgi:hypothetical protein